jgi:hypothetical protein
LCSFDPEPSLPPTHPDAYDWPQLKKLGKNWEPTLGAAKAADAIKSIVVKSRANKKAVEEAGGGLLVG